MHSRSRLALAFLIAAPSLRFAGEPAGDDAYVFRQPPANSRGLKSLAELRGKPVLIDFWGTR